MRKILETAAKTGDLKAIKRLFQSERSKTEKFVLAQDDIWKNAFFVACGSDQPSIVSFFVRHGMKPHSFDDNGKTSLMYACENGCNSTVKFLLKSRKGNIEVDWCDNEGRTALIYCTQNGHLSTVKLLGNYVLNIDARDLKGKNALMYSCEKRFALSEFLVYHNIDLDAQDNEGKTALIHACLCGNHSLTAFLLEQDACADIKDNVGNTALIYAVQQRNEECMKALCAHGHIDYDVRGERGRTALIHAINLGSECDFFVSLLLAKGAKVSVEDDDAWNAILHACAKNYLKTAKQMIDCANTLNGETLGFKFWYKILSYCCRVGVYEIVKLYIEDELALEMVPFYEHYKQPLMFACESGHTEIVDLLMNYGGNYYDNQPDWEFYYINKSDQTGKTALMYASANGHLDIVKILAKFKVQAYVRDMMGKMALTYACESGDVRIVNILIPLTIVDTSIDTPDCFSVTPLMVACKGGNLKIINSIINNNADINACDEAGDSVLMRSCKDGLEKVVRLLLSKQGINVNYRNANGETALLYAARFGHERIVHHLLNHETAVDIDCADKYRRTALLVAARDGHEKIVDLLLQNHPDINAKCDFGFTPLLQACAKNHEKIVQLLINHNADPTIRLPSGMTVMGLALSMKYENILTVLVRAGNHIDSFRSCRPKVLIFACEAGNADLVKQLMLRSDVNINERDAYYRTALICASMKGHDLLVDMLLGNPKLDINAYDGFKKTALMYASMNGNHKVVHLLINRGDLNVNMCDCVGRTALIYASIFGHDKIVSLLLHVRGILVNLCDREWRTALIHASQKGLDKIVSLLVSKSGIWIDASDIRSRTALIYACRIECEGIVRTLLNSRASCDMYDCDEKSALMYALSAQDKGLIQVLMTHISDVHRHDYDWQFALGCACMVGYDDIARRIANEAFLRDVDFTFGDYYMTPLAYASKMGNLYIVTLLVTGCDCDVNFSDLHEKTPLMYAAEGGHVEVVDFLIRHGAHICKRDDLSKSALTYAKEKAHCDIICMLLQPTDDFDSILGTECNKQTALMFACEQNYVKLVDRLLTFSIDVNARDVHGRTALLQICERGQVTDNSILEILLKQKDININAQDDDGKTALIYACSHGCEAMVGALVQAAAEPNIKDNTEENTALMRLCSIGLDRHSILNVLIQGSAKPDFNVQNKVGKTALMIAIENGNNDIAALLIKQCVGSDLPGCDQEMPMEHSGEQDCNFLNVHDKSSMDLNLCDSVQRTALMYACEHGNLEIVKLLKGCSSVDINVQDSNGMCAFMHACEEGHAELVQEFIQDQRVLINMRDIKGQTSLIRASIRKHAKIVEILLHHNADAVVVDDFNKSAFTYAILGGSANIVRPIVNHLVRTNPGARQGSFNGYNAIIYAYRAGFEDIVNVFIEAYVGEDSKDHHGKTILMYASENGRVGLVKKLVDYNMVKLDYQDKDGFTALMYACMNQQKETVILLLNYGADVDICDGSGMTALMFACKAGNTDIVRHLLRYRAHVNARDKFGRTALWYCCPYWHTDLLDCFTMWGSPTYFDNRNSLYRSGRELTREDRKCIVDAVNLDIVYLLIKERLNINALPQNGESLLMFAAKLDGDKKFRPKMDSLLRCSLVNVDIVNEGATVLSYALKGSGYAMRALLNSRKLLDRQGCLKQVHRNTVVVNSEVSFRALYTAIKNGIFDWRWCPSRSMQEIGLAALRMGYSPGSVDYESIGRRSPMIAACLDENEAVVKMFLDKLYFLPEDCKVLYNSDVYKSCVQDDEVPVSKPLSLLALSTLSVSKAISMTDDPTNRAERVDALPLPQLLKRKLKFEGCDIELLDNLQSFCNDVVLNF